MAPRKRVTKKSEPTWDEIGSLVGKKVEKYEKKDCFPWKNRIWFHHHEHGGGFGRLIFVIGVLIAMSSLGMLAGIPSYALVLIIVGFWLMKF